MNIVLILASFFACAGYCIVTNLKGKTIFYASLGGVIGFCAFELFRFTNNDIVQYFIATIVIEIYAEIMARVMKQPVTVYLIVALLPLVPGGGLYYTMEYGINGDIAMFIKEGLHTLFIAGSLVGGIIVVASIVRLMDKIIHHKKVIMNQKI